MALLQTHRTSLRSAPGAAQRRLFAQWVSRHAAILMLGCAACCSYQPSPAIFSRQVAGWTMILGIIALSLMFLAGYGGMVSLAQMTVAGVSGYMIAVFGASSLPAISLFWPWWVAAPIAIVIAVAFGTLTGVLSVAHRRHLHDHDHARDRSGLLLSDPAELANLQRLRWLHHYSRADFFRRQLEARRSRSII